MQVQQNYSNNLQQKRIIKHGRSKHVTMQSKGTQKQSIQMLTMTAQFTKNSPMQIG
jgi:hypothetical protein